MALLAAGVLAIATNVAHAQVQINDLFAFGGGSVAWTGATNPVDAPGDLDGQALQLTLPGPGASAGIDLFRAPSAPPSAPPSFVFQSSVSGAAQASPRLVIAFSDGDYIDLHPATWTAGTWTKVDGATANWDDAGHGGCQVAYSVSYQQALACHVADHATVSDLYVVSDAGVSGGYVNYIDDISYAGTTITTGAEVAGTISPQLLSFKHRARIAIRTGEGSFSVGCVASPGEKCHVALKLTAKVNNKTVVVGKIKGLILTQQRATVYILLNGLGRKLLLEQGSLAATATGRISDDTGFSVTSFNQRLTLRAS